MTKKQMMFCNEYLIDLNATRAYRAIYPNVKSDIAAANSAVRLLKREDVKKYVDERMQDIERRTGVTQDKVVKELANIAFAKASDYAKVIEKQAVYTTEDGHRIPLDNEDGSPVMVNAVELALTESLSPEQISAIAGIKHGRFGIEVTLNDKMKALELLGRHLGMFKDKVEVTGIDEQKSKLDDLVRQMRGDD